MGNVKYLFVKITNFKPQGFWPGFSAGFFYFGFIFWWFWDLYPLDEFGLESKLIAGIILIIAFILYVATMALPWGISSLILVKFIKKIRSRNLVPFLIASIFTLAEYSRAILFSVVLYGDGGKIGPHWTMEILLIGLLILIFWPQPLPFGESMELILFWFRFSHLFYYCLLKQLIRNFF